MRTPCLTINEFKYEVFAIIEDGTNQKYILCKFSHKGNFVGNILVDEKNIALTDLIFLSANVGNYIRNKQIKNFLNGVNNYRVKVYASK